MLEGYLEEFLEKHLQQDYWLILGGIPEELPKEILKEFVEEPLIPEETSEGKSEQTPGRISQVTVGRIFFGVNFQRFDPY